MLMHHWIRLLLSSSLIGVMALNHPVAAEETPRPDPLATGQATSAPPPDKSFLDALAKDLGLSLSRSSEFNLTLPLSPSQWTLGGLRPYAVVSPRVWRPVSEGTTGLATPERETEADLSHGLGLGAGLTWRLSNRFDLFGQYLFRANPSGNSPAGNPTLRPDLDVPGLKGGFSIRF
jgi:hypothetical protein